MCDVTSRDVEGTPNELAAFGYNWDRQKGRKPMVLGRRTSPEGGPPAVEVFKGHPGDPPPVAAQVTRLQESFKLKPIVRVGDRGRLTQVRIREDRLPLGLDGISARRRDPICPVGEKDGERSTGLMSAI